MLKHMTVAEKTMTECKGNVLRLAWMTYRMLGQHQLLKGFISAFVSHST